MPANWRAYFDSLSLGESVTPADAAAVGQRQLALAERQNRVDQLIRNYRVRAHNINDVSLMFENIPRDNHMCQRM